MANEMGTVGTQRRAVIGRRISGGASSSPVVSPALGTTSAPVTNATPVVTPVPEVQPSVSAPVESAPVNNMTATTDVHSSYNGTPVATPSESIGHTSNGVGSYQPVGGSLSGNYNGPTLSNPLAGGPSLNAYGSSSSSLGGATNPYSQLSGNQMGTAPAPQAAPVQQMTPPPMQQAAPVQQMTPPPMQQAAPVQQMTPPPAPQAAPAQPIATTEQLVSTTPAEQPMTRTARDEELPPPSPVPQLTRPVIQKEEVVSNPNPTIGSYMASKESSEDDLYALLNGIGKESKLEKRKTMKEMVSGVTKKLKKPKDA